MCLHEKKTKYYQSISNAVSINVLFWYIRKYTDFNYGVLIVSKLIKELRPTIYTLETCQCQ